MKLLLLFLALTGLFSCKQKSEITVLPSDSIFHLKSSWKKQNGETVQLKDLRGKTLVVVMIYTTCKSACPRLVANMKRIEQQVSQKNLSKVSMILVSIDPATDTPERLKKFAELNDMEASHFTFLTGSEESTQEFANVLSMKYKKISPIDFSHSNIVTVFSPDGQMQFQEEGLDINTKKVAEKVNEVAENN